MTACEDDGKKLPLHGAVSNTMAENTYAVQEVEFDESVLKICGEVREACLLPKICSFAEK